MNASAFCVLLLAASATVAAADEKKKDEEPYFHGVATLEAGGKICLQLLTKEPGQPAAHGFFCYKPGDKKYDDIRKHVGPIKEGEEKVIEPFD